MSHLFKGFLMFLVTICFNFYKINFKKLKLEITLSYGILMENERRYMCMYINENIK